MIDLGAVALIKNIDVKAAVVVIRVFKEELNNPFAGEAIHHRRQLNVIGFHLHRQPVQLVVRDSAVELNGVFQLLHRNVKTLEEQPPRLAGDAQRFEAPGILAGTGETQFDAFGDHLLHAGADQAAQVLAIAEHLHAVRRRGVLMHFAEDRLQRFDHRLLAVKVQRTHFVPRVAIQQVDAADQTFLLFTEAENIQFTEVEVHHLIAEGRGRVIFEVDDNRQMADFARAVQCFWRRRRQAQREVVRHVGHHLLQLRQIDDAVALNKQAGA